MPSYSLWLLLSACSVALASHFYAEFLYFIPKGSDPHGPFRVDIRYRQTYDHCYHYDDWYCASGNCGSEDRFEMSVVENGAGVNYTINPWCQTDALMTRNLQSNRPFEMERYGCCWIYNYVDYWQPWQLLTHVDLGIRSDTDLPNTSPVTAILPFIRIPRNCPRTINLLAHDPDADRVRCRYGLNQLFECAYCVQHSGFILDQNHCTLNYNYTSIVNILSFEMVLEDFPMQTISLSYTDDTMATKSPSPVRKKRSGFHHYSYPWYFTTPAPAMPKSDPLSKIPLHFSIQVDPDAPSCTVGQYLPQFLEATPGHGDILLVGVGQELIIKLKATATRAQVNNFIISGPQNFTKSIIISGAVGEAEIRWTPNDDYLGEHVPICFIAESIHGYTIYHSEMRCIIANVTRLSVNAHVVCSETTMTVEVEKASVVGLHEDHLRLLDASCTPISNSTHVIAAVSLGSCGTELKEDGDNLVFRNEIMSYDNPNAVITRVHEVEIEFSCYYPKKSRISLEFRSHKLPYVFTEKGFGQFTYQFEFFQSNLFDKTVAPESYPVQVPLKEKLYMLINSTSSLSDTELFVESCRATPVDDPNYHIYYDIIKDGCIMDDTVVIDPSDPTEFRFEIEAFQFIGQHEEAFISCSVILSEAGNPNSRRSQGCISATTTYGFHHHRKRAAVVETARHSISQGPVRLKKTADFTASNVGFNMNLAFIAVVLLLVVVIVCGAVIYVAKRPKVKYQTLPSTDF
ncbi:hypothetical protein GJAV_G00228640 [Gymnothorax javanicus]|nr:hypothetical protein GJAV_G00228640 [Gymnothorax javanicus]